MYAIYGNIYHQYTPNVSIYTPYMDPMGIYIWLVVEPPLWKKWKSMGRIIHSYYGKNRVEWNMYLVGGWATPLKNMTSSAGIIVPNIWKKRFMFQTTRYIVSPSRILVSDILNICCSIFFGLESSIFWVWVPWSHKKCPQNLEENPRSGDSCHCSCTSAN